MSCLLQLVGRVEGVQLLQQTFTVLFLVSFDGAPLGLCHTVILCILGSQFIHMYEIHLKSTCLPWLIHKLVDREGIWHEVSLHSDMRKKNSPVVHKGNLKCMMHVIGLSYIASRLLVLGENLNLLILREIDNAVWSLCDMLNLYIYLSEKGELVAPEICSFNCTSLTKPTDIFDQVHGFNDVWKRHYSD